MGDSIGKDETTLLVAYYFTAIFDDNFAACGRFVECRTVEPTVLEEAAECGPTSKKRTC